MKKTMFLVLLLLLIASVRGAIDIPSDIQSYQACRTMSRETLLECFSSLVDTNHNNILEGSEIVTFLTANNIPSETVLMRVCDIDQDGSLTMADWNAPTSCAHSQPIITRACNICVRAGWSAVASAKKGDPQVTAKHH